MGKFIKGIAAGAVIGMAVEMVMVSKMDKRTQRSMRRAAKKMMNMAEDTYDVMVDWIR